VIAWILLLAAVAAAVGAYAIGWPAWRRYRDRDARDANAERYLAWRGRATRAPAPSMREGPTMAERRRFYLAAALGVLAVVCLVGFFATS